MGTQTLAANMRRAFIDRKSAKIGGGIFTPEELRDGAFMLNLVPELLAAMEVCVKQCADYENMTDECAAAFRNARAAIAKARGLQ